MCACGDRSIKSYDQLTNEWKSLVVEEASILTIALSPDQKLIAAGFHYQDRSVKLFDALTGKLVAALGKHSSGVRALAFSRDGRFLASGSGEDPLIHLWSISTLSRVGALDSRAKGIWALCFSPASHKLFAGSDTGKVSVWDVESFQETGCLNKHTEYINGIVCMDEGSLATSSSDGSAIVWDLKTGSPAFVLSAPGNRLRAVAVDPTSQALACGSVNGRVYVWDLRTRELKDAFYAHNATISAIAFVSSDELVTSCAAYNLQDQVTDGEVALWRLKRTQE